MATLVDLVNTIIAELGMSAAMRTTDDDSTVLHGTGIGNAPFTGTLGPPPTPRKPSMPWSPTKSS
ncbi:MAG: hypothetical protein R2710_08750 [Acidimicrobiales bacterium]